MAASKVRRRKRSKTLMILFFPALLFIGIMGWCLYAAGEPKRPVKVKPKPKLPKKDSNDGVTIMPIIFEETPEITNN